LPTFTQEEWRAPAVQLLPWIAAALLGGFGGWIASRRKASPFSVGMIEVAVFAVVAAAASRSFPEVARRESAARGTLAMLDAFDPIGRRGYDYATATKLAEDQWLRRSTLVFEREPGSDPDRLGRFTEALTLPPGRYQAQLWFQGDRPHDGALQAAFGTGEGQVFQQIDGPLSNPAILTVDLPVPIRALWILLTDPASARAARRLEVKPLSLLPAGERGANEVHAVELVPGRPNAYLAFTDERTYPENGVFWTRGSERGTMLLAPAGATTLVITVHVGPVPTPVTIWVDETRSEVALAAEETRVVRMPLPAAARMVSVAVQAGSSFRPSEVAKSDDSRSLGCQVRLSLE
jgi:hypothetical protein